MLFEVFPAVNPPVPVFGIGTHGSPEIIGEITFTVPVNTVRHATRNLQAFHSRQTSLCVCLVESQAQHKKGLIQHILSCLFDFKFVNHFGCHDIRVFHPDSLVSAPFFSTNSIINILSSGIVNCGTVYTVRTVLLPPITSISL